MEYCLAVCYPADKWPSGDDEVCEAVGRKDQDGSGMGFGERDMQFYFKNKEEAEAARKKVMEKCKFVVYAEITE